MSIPAAISSLAQRSDELVEQLESWANLNSGSSHIAGLAQMRKTLRTAFAAIPGVLIEEIPLVGTPAQALRVRLHPAASRQIFLSGHYDTVYEADHPFQTCSRLDENTLRGPGVADMKGGLVVMLAALQAFAQTPAAAKLGGEVLLTPDEETGSHASAPLFAEAAKRCQFGLVFEAARVTGDLVYSRKGTGQFAVTCRGRAAHVALANEGRNAVVALAAFVQAVSKVPEELPGVLLNVVRFNSGEGASNIVPDQAEVLLDVRVTRVADQGLVLARLHELIAAANSADGIHLELKGGFNRPPKECGPVEEFAFAAWQQAAADLGLAPFSWIHTGGGSDGNLLAAAGMPNLDGVGPVGGQLHSDREFCMVPTLVERAQVVALFLHRVAAGEILLPVAARSTPSLSAD
ncbi:MAG: hydrolase [Cephaloticoccus sp.]|nr:hydrolase [Cephaloticoccus sp.]